MTSACSRCDWSAEPDAGPSRSQLREHSLEAGHPLCVVCFSSLPRDRPQTCLPCLADVRRGLVGVVDLYALLPVLVSALAYGEPAAPRDGSRSGEAAIPGGSRLVMLAGGSRALASVWDDDAEREGDPQSVAFELGRWEDDWRLVRGEPAAEALMSVSGAWAYLGPRLGWAADQHLAFEEFAADVAQLLARLRSVTATGDRPVRGAPCLSCGSSLERHWTAKGLADDWRCSRCPRTYTAGEYARAMQTRWQLAVRWRRQELGWTTRELAAELDITMSGVRQIVRRHQVLRMGTGERGAALYDPDEVRRHA